VGDTRAITFRCSSSSQGRVKSCVCVFKSHQVPLGCSPRRTAPPSRQERRKAERSAAKRAAPARAGAAGAAAASADVNTVGDWTTIVADPFKLFAAIGDTNVRRKADAGDGGAQYSLGYSIMLEVEKAGVARPIELGAAGRSPKADVGLTLCTFEH